MPIRRYTALVIQSTSGTRYAVHAPSLTDAPILLTGAVQRDGIGHVWFQIGRHPGRLVGAVMRLARALVAQHVGDFPHGLQVHVAPGHRAGERIARFCGFCPTPMNFGPFRIWERSE
ncbi:MAG: hypothetical protein AAFQ35_07305 [Pseudomonadota bacterium]